MVQNYQSEIVNTIIAKIIRWARDRKDIIAVALVGSCSLLLRHCDTHTPKDLSVRLHECICGYQTDRDVAAAQVVKKRGLLNLNADGQAVFQNVCGDGLTGAVMSTQESKRQKPQTAKFGIPR
jgi:putative transposase